MKANRIVLHSSHAISLIRNPTKRRKRKNSAQLGPEGGGKVKGKKVFVSPTVSGAISRLDELLRFFCLRGDSRGGVSSREAISNLLAAVAKRLERATQLAAEKGINNQGYRSATICCKFLEARSKAAGTGVEQTETRIYEQEFGT